MKYNPKKHHRRSIRLKGYDYSQPGAYFITICSKNRECLFGEIVNGEMRLNQYGRIVYDEWFLSVKIRNEIKLYEDEFVVMPNHIHGIVWIVRANGRSPLNDKNPKTKQHGPRNKSLSSFIAGYKSIVTKQINIIRQTPGISIWQHNYYEHIIRNQWELQQIKKYINNNPRNWIYDENYK